MVLSNPFYDLPKSTCTREDIKSFLEDKSSVAKRINFATSHAEALKRTPDGKSVGIFKVPFKKCIEPILGRRAGISLYKSQYDDKLYTYIKTEEDYEFVNEFFEKYKNIVFLRDNLELSLALSMNMEKANEDEERNRTEIGELEYQAKYNNNQEAEDNLVGVCQDWLNELPYYKMADYICAMPAREGENKLPKRIVDRLDGFDFENISGRIYWNNKTRSVKEAGSVEEKLAILDESELVIPDDLDLKGKTVLLFDDLYMSGISMQYVAMKLKEVGAARVLGLNIVKSWGNTAKSDE